MKRFKILCLLNVLFIVILSTACKNAKTEKNILAFDTVVTLAAEGENSKKVLKDAANFLEELNKKSDFSKDSELTKINEAPANSFTEVSSEIYEMIKSAKFYTDCSKGNYDVSAGALTTLWETARENEKIPEPDEVVSAKSKVNADDIELSEGKVKKSSSGTKITLGGIAKGYAADKVYSLYKANNVSGLLNFGTSAILACGEKEYRIGIKNPRDEKSMLGVVVLKNEVLSTSGDYERYFIKDGVRYHHIINTKTGYPADSGIASATVIIPLSYENAGAMSDALSTALIVAGENGKAFLPKYAKAMLVTTTGELIFINGFKLESNL